MLILTALAHFTLYMIMCHVGKHKFGRKVDSLVASPEEGSRFTYWWFSFWEFLTLLRDQCDFFSPPKGKIKCTIYFKQKFKKMSDVANMIQIKTNICKLILICKKKKTVVRRFNKHSIFKNILFSSNYLIVQALEVKLAVDVRWRMCLKCLKWSSV